MLYSRNICSFFSQKEPQTNELRERKRFRVMDWRQWWFIHTRTREHRMPSTFDGESDVTLMMDALGFGLRLLWLFNSLMARQAKRANADPPSIHDQAELWINSTAVINPHHVTSWRAFIQTTNNAGAQLSDSGDNGGPDVRFQAAVALTSTSVSVFTWD